MAWMDTYADQIGSYSQEYVSAAQIDAMRGSHPLGIFMRMDCDPALHVWMGVNDIPAGIDSLDEGGTVYLGGGRLLNVPTLEILINGQSDDVEFGISGIDPATAQKVVDEMPDVRGADVHIGITPLDQYYQPVGSIVTLWLGTASHTRESMPPVTGTDTRTMTLGLAVVSGNNTRSRPSLSMWSSPHQKALYPTDKGCDNVSRIARGVAPAWPDY
jgi:hypothetical protein